MATSSVPLRLRSRYTRAGGTIAASALGACLKQHGFRAGALRDRGDLYGALEFYEGCLTAGVKPIIGADLTCPVSGAEIGLVALNREGYAGLCAAISSLTAEREVSALEAIERAPEGLAIISAEGETALAAADRFGRERVWLELVPNREGARAIRSKADFARAKGLKILGSWEVLCLQECDQATSLVLRAIDEGRTIDEVAMPAREASLERCSALEGALAAYPEALAESARLAEMVELSLDLGRPHFPRLESSHGESVSRLRRLAWDALARKYGAHGEAARARLAQELDTIEKLGLADYFLVVADIVAFAAARGIPVAGRGSGVGSIVAYLVGITQVDPVAEQLIFERFLNELRPDYPDIDLDISWKRRDEVIDYVYRRFGRANVAMISTRACFETRLAAREVAKAFGLSPYEAQALADRLPYHGSPTAGAIAAALGTVKPGLDGEHRESIARLSATIVGFPNHSSVHCGGIVVSDRPITYYTPLETAPKGIRVTQFDMHSIERIGLIKIDLLGNRVLSLLEEATRDIQAACGRPPDIQGDDARTASVLERGQTMSCFQLESPAMRNLLCMIRARTRADATLALALVRPGPSAGGMKQEFVRRRARARRDGAATDVADGHVAQRTDGGLPVFEEDVLRLIAKHTGVGFAEADIFRRCLKEGGGDDPALQDKFLFLAETWGTDRATALEAWSHIRRFARYTFSKAHASPFGTLAYAAAYLKTHFPLQFYAAALRNHSGMYPLWAHVNEARRVGIVVLPPSINRSERDFAVEGTSVRTGLSSVKHLAGHTIDAILAERQREPFRSLGDFLCRVASDREETLALVSSGAFDEIEPARCEAMAEYLATRGKLAPTGALAFSFADTPRPFPTRAFTALQLRRMEYATLAFSPLVHPLEFFYHAPQPLRGPAGSKGGRQPRLVVRGLLAALRHYHDRGPGLWFLSLDDPDGIHEIIVGDGVTRDRFEIGAAYAAEGAIQHRFGAATLKAAAIHRLGERPD
ncbi:MAG TPA: DNA polymerase III subunit alpha [bacterium]|nr:DNA polymerase III subunit alpha [bacterium]